MYAPTTIPVTVTPEATAHVAELGMEKELDQMLEHARQTIPGLQRLDVWLAPPYDTGDEDSVIIGITRAFSSRVENDPTWDQWRDWKIQTFPPEVCIHFATLIGYGRDHVG
jgi:hypothetical protein